MNPTPDDHPTHSLPADVASTAAFFAGPAAGSPPPPAPAERYELHAEIARGGMGVVFAALDVALNREVAVKVLREEYRDRPAVRRRFVDEAQITGQLQHPGIPPVHDLGTLPDGRPFLAMKLVRGRTLADLLADVPPDLPHLLGVFERICLTVAYAHSKGVIHRDLKPSNVMVGAYGEVLVVDWGVAKALRNAERGLRNDSDEPAPPRGGLHSAFPIPHSELPASGRTPPTDETKAGSVLGTPAYMPLEQARGDVARHDTRTDVFALGAILCELLTGKPPYTGEVAEVWAAARAGDTGPAIARLDKCQRYRPLAELAVRCLAVDAMMRPTDAGEVAAAVADAAARRDWRRRTAGRVAATVVVAAASAAVAYYAGRGWR